MATNIEWVKNPDGTKGETWNVVTGCTKISAGCKHCYAERMARRLAGRFGYPEAPNHFDVTLHLDKLEQPLQRNKPTTYFVCSMGDLFHECVKEKWLWRIFKIMAAADRHTYQVLTKRPQRMLEFCQSQWYQGLRDIYGLNNVWLGVTVEGPDYLWRIEELLKVPAAIHYVSVEPMLGPVDLHKGLGLYKEAETVTVWYGDGHCKQARKGFTRKGFSGYRRHDGRKLDWVVCGGESGPAARPMDPQWPRDLRDQCIAAGTPFHFKQWGAWVPVDQWGARCQTKAAIADMGRVYRWPDGSDSLHIGKKAAGRLLDGVTWDQMPEEQRKLL